MGPKQAEWKERGEQEHWGNLTGKFGCSLLPQTWRGGRGPRAGKEGVQSLPFESWWEGMAIIPRMLAEPGTLSGSGIQGTARGGSSARRGNLVPPGVASSNRPMGLSGHICGASCGQPSILGPSPPHGGEAQPPLPPTQAMPLPYQKDAQASMQTSSLYKSWHPL